MPKFPKPFFRKGRGWYVQIGKEQIKLANGPENSETEAEALKRYHELMADRGRDKPAISATVPDSPLVSTILDKYLGWCKRERAIRTYDWYRDHIQHFLDSLPNADTLTVKELKPFHIIEWVGKNESWSPSYHRGAIIAIQRPFSWAEELGYIDVNPVKKVHKPQATRRDNPMTPEDFNRLLAKVKEGDPFRDLILFGWYAGCRPQEARHIEPRHVHLESQCIIIPKEEAKGKKRPRIIHLHGPALDIVTRLMQIRTQGKLFLNSKSTPWKAFALCNRFDRLMLSFGMDALKEAGIALPSLPRFDPKKYRSKGELAAARKEHKKKVCDHHKEIVKLAREHGKGFAAYDLRHGFCQRLLENGANHLVVAELMGHANGQMVAAVYSHMNRATEHLKETLKKASASDAEA